MPARSKKHVQLLVPGLIVAMPVLVRLSGFHLRGTVAAVDNCVQKNRLECVVSESLDRGIRVILSGFQSRLERFRTLQPLFKKGYFSDRPVL